MSSTDGPDADAEAADHLGPLPMPGAVPATRHAAASEPRPSIGASTTSLGSTTSDGRRRFSIEANSMNQVASFGPDMHSRSAASIAGSAANIRVLAGGDCGDAGSGGASSGNGGTTKPPAPTPHLVRLAGGGYAHAATVASTHVQGAGAAASASATAGDAGIGAAHGASTHLQAARTDIADIRSPERRQDPAQRMPLNPSVPATANADRARARAPSMSMVPSFQHVSAASDGRLSALDRLRQSPVAVKITDVMASPVYIVLVMLTSVWAIVSYDVRVLWASPDADDSFVVVTLLLVALFVVEVAAYSLLVRGYFLSFFFWIDILATVSLLPDVLATTWTREPSDDVHDSVLEDSLRDNLRVSPAARMLRVMRVMRASRVGLVGVSLGQALSSWREGHTSKQEASLMGRTLVYHTHVIVIAGIVVLLLGTSTLESAAADDDGAAREGLRMLHVAAPAMLALGTAGAGNWTSLVDTYVSNVQGIAASDRGASFGVLHLSVRGEVLVDWSARGGAAESGLRVVGPAEVLAVSCNDATASPLSPLPPFTSLAAGTTGLEGDGPDVSRVVLSIRGSVEAHAATDLAQCTLVLAVLTVWLLLCSAEFHRLVLIPLERMLSLLQQMMRDPLAAVDMSHGATAVSGSGLSRASARSHEMAVVEASLAKFGKLLQLGFGDAGARIIARSLNQGKLDVMAPGNKVVAALAFCDIRSFTECCECLRQHVLTFTNAVGHEVSQAVHGNGGCVNKNIGDAFFSVWKIRDRDEDDLLPRQAEGWGEGIAVDKSLAESCDNALKACIEANRRVAASAAVQAVAKSPMLQARLPGYSVTLGHGLHLGWAIEGAVGSHFKIDATYLSPHVNITARLESLTKKYGVTILASGQFSKRLSEQYKRHMRPVDRVTVKGSAVPVLLEAWDEQSASEPLGPGSPSEAFLTMWRRAFTRYVDGEWAAARRGVEACLASRPGDGPAMQLLEFMGSHAPPFEMPEGWQGYRVLDSKT